MSAFRRIPRAILATAATAVLAGLGASEPKNIIYMIGDGMGGP